MLNDSELEALLRDLESDRVERKASGIDRDKIAEAICAFANDLPNHGRQGVIFIGVDDAGQCAGLHITDQLLTALPDLRTNGNIHPFPSMTVQKRIISGCEMIVIEVSPSDFTPIRFRGRTMIRVGARRSIATVEEERRLVEKRRYRDIPFDLRPVDGASIDDLDLDMFQGVYLPAAVAQDVLEQNARTDSQQLISLRLMSPAGEPTVAGILSIGRDPRQFVGGAYIQFVRFSGVDLTSDIKAQREINGPFPESLRLIDAIIEAHVSVASEFRSQHTEVRRADYPKVAIQQLVRNAVLHRNYEGTNAPVRINWFEDRIEIQNPGGPFGQVTVENFGQPGITDYRNAYLAETMKVLGYVQRFGVGIQTARSELKKNGNPPPEFVVNLAHTLAILRRMP